MAIKVGKYGREIDIGEEGAVHEKWGNLEIKVRKIEWVV